MRAHGAKHTVFDETDGYVGFAVQSLLSVWNSLVPRMSVDFVANRRKN